MTKVVARSGEETDKLIKRFIVSVNRSGVPSEMKKHRVYEKPGVRRKNKEKEMLKNFRKKNRNSK